MTTGYGQGNDGLALPVVDVPPPAGRILPDPRVPEAGRKCGECGAPVGAGGRPAEGTCPNCGTRFSFSPKLRAGDLVAGQYEVLGCIARGGLGWIYLAEDRHLDGKHVVLK